MILPASSIFLVVIYILTSIAIPIGPFDPDESPNDYMRIAPRWMQTLVNQRYSECLLEWFQVSHLSKKNTITTMMLNPMFQNRERFLRFWNIHEMHCHERDQRIFWLNERIYPDGPRVEDEPSSEEELIALLGKRYKRPSRPNTETQGGQDGSGTLPFSLHDTSKTIQNNLVRLGGGIETAIRGTQVPRSMMGLQVRPVRGFIPI